MNRVLVPQIDTPPVAPRNALPVELRGETMGTNWSVRAFAPAGFDAARFEAEIEALFADIIAQMSPWVADSLINRFNDLPADEWLELPTHFNAVLDCALRVAAETGGAFDPTLGALVDLWGFGARAPSRDPSAEQVGAALQASGWRKLKRDGARLWQPGGLRLDLNGVAKGYAVDQLAASAARAGLPSYLVEIGGELKGAGVKPDGQPWWVELEHPNQNATRERTLVALHNLAIATSGDYRRFEIVDGERISHTVSPQTGQPMANAIASVSVLHASCMFADAYATALQVRGINDGISFADSIDLAAVMVARADIGYAETMSRAAQALA